MHITARLSMVERYLRSHVRDPRILEAMEQLPRHLFVDPALQSRAYHNDALPIGFGQTISQPLMVARMTEQLQVEQHHCVLEIGTGSGYQAAILAALCREVFTVERLEPLAMEARERFEQLGIPNIHTAIADGTVNAFAELTFDRILITAGGNRHPSSLLRQLIVGGILIAPIGTDKHQTLYRYIRTAANHWQRTPIGDCHFVKLIGEEGWQDQEKEEVVL
ncbi:protein-L-isoaspartate(D-aspartate) O-methyltransferase [Desulfurispira natronophila]|uniref:Protein-L-isoaspartate O-methyltransferase n=1 Tax=Desulfurispira natronophila TaxID=682562 RepID=A0A7W7Y457_9BACT|nr:protein-L-isoaspartate(D-aspartate) O-methyltransferase [Desulfurispira natronophila]MBB5021776.1 protein-L-isoaspartate(D-aspartate) O-methyltransferase [Desulfurispira natronophila]